MANVIRTKFQVVERLRTADLYVVSLRAMVNGKFADVGTSGGGHIALTVSDPATAAHFLPGTSFHVDFTEV